MPKRSEEGCVGGAELLKGRGRRRRREENERARVSFFYLLFYYLTKSKSLSYFDSVEH